MVWGAAGEAGDRKGAEAAGEKRSFKEEEELEQMGRNGQSGRFWNYGSGGAVVLRDDEVQGMGRTAI